MKIKVLTALFLVAIAASAMAADTPSVEAKIVQLDPGPQMFAFRGPVTVQYQLTIQNPLPDRTITLRRIALRTQGGGAYSLRVNDPIKFTVNPDSSATINLNAVARSSGGFIRQSEPVDLMVQLWFDQEGGKSFVKQFMEYLPQE